MFVLALEMIRETRPHRRTPALFISGLPAPGRRFPPADQAIMTPVQDFPCLFIGLSAQIDESRVLPVLILFSCRFFSC